MKVRRGANQKNCKVHFRENVIKLPKEFEWTRNLAVQQGMQMPKVIARPLIQSFDIGEVTPEQAHEIGKQFADEWLKGKYEYVLSLIHI